MSTEDGPVVLEVVHTTRYAYSSPVEVAHHIACLHPLDQPGLQRLLAHALAIAPAPADRHGHVDAFGNRRTLFATTAPHEALEVVATSRVELADAATPATDWPWERCRAHWRYRAGHALPEGVEHVFASPRVPLLDALARYAAPSFAPGRPLDAAALELMRRVHADFRYEPASTEVDTPVAQAFAQRRGVCQDFAHVMIGCLRALGLAARYVSGYLLTEPPPGEDKLLGADASHAWVGVALPRGDGRCDWLELDPTNACVAGSGHVRLAVGRDYGDVTPLGGVIRGGGAHVLSVHVSTRRWHGPC